MSRSIHSTRRELARLARFGYRDEEQHAAGLRRVREQLATKREIKWRVRDDLTRLRVPEPPTVSGSLPPIPVIDESRYTH